MLHSVRLFYLLSGGATYVIWAILSVGGGGDFHKRSLVCPLLTRTRMLPTRLLLYVRRKQGLYLFICRSAPAALLACALCPEVRALRLFAALYFGLYCFLESSATHSHREFAILYCAVAAAVLPDDSLVQGVAFGVGVHFLSSSGFAKAAVGGAGAWADPSTLGAILQTYGRLTLGQGGPPWPGLTAWICRRPLLLRLLGGGTLAFELLLVPSILFWPPELRPLAGLAALSMHLGIALTQSIGIGLAFLPNIAVYALGFAADGAAPWSTGGAWHAALSVVGVSVLGVFIASGTRIAPVPFDAVPKPRTHLLSEVAWRHPWPAVPISEEWPLTNFALFPWNGAQWTLLFHWLYEGRTRLVILPARSSDHAAAAAEGAPHDDSGVAAASASAASKASAAANGGGADAVLHYTADEIIGGRVYGKYDRDDDDDSSPGAASSAAAASHTAPRARRASRSPQRQAANASSCHKRQGRAASGSAASAGRGASPPAASANDTHGIRRAPPPRLYDGWEQVIGETLLHPQVLAGIDVASMAHEGYVGHDLVHAVADWLRSDRRLIRAADGRPMVAAALVRLGSNDNTVVQVLSIHPTHGGRSGRAHSKVG